MKRHLLALAGLGLLTATLPSYGSVTLTIDFDKTPALQPQPTRFETAGPARTITVPGIATIQGGTVLNNPFLLRPFNSQSSGGNAYGTAYFGSSGYSSTIELDINPAIRATDIEGLLFNGQARPVTYTVTAYSGSRVVQQQVLSNVPATDSANGFASFALKTDGFTKVLFTPSFPTRFDYFLDNLRITYTEYQVNPAEQVVPEPATLTGAVVATLIGLMATCRRRRPVP